MGEARVPGVTTGFAAEPGADVTGDAFGLVKICSFPSGICTSCCPGRRPRTWILPSLERTIWTFCCGWLAAEDGAAIGAMTGAGWTGAVGRVTFGWGVVVL